MTRRPDPFLEVVVSLRDYVQYITKVASWKLTLSCTCALVSRLMWPILPNDLTVRGLLGLAAVSLGACVGRLIDRKLAGRGIASGTE